MMSQGTDCVLDVFVKEERVERVKHYIEHVQKLYCVAAQFTSAVGKQCMLSPGCWIDVEGKRENVVKAREYLKGLSQPEEVVRLRFPAPVYDLICGKDGQLLFDLERESAANIVFYSSEEVEISGWIAGVTKASSVIEDVIKNFIKENSATDHADDDYEGADSLASVEEDSGIFMKCNLESESEVDIDTCDFNQSSALSPDECLDNQSCESLASDLSEVKDSKCTVCHQPSTQADTELMEYAKKLGYSEGQVKSAMKKLAADTIDQNELLHELIKASNSIRDGKIIGENGKADLSAIQSFYASVSEPPVDANSLKHIVVDGSNVAMSHGKNQTFSCRGIALCVDWFQKRGHNVTVFVPNWRKEASKPDTPITDQDILLRLSDEGILSFTPSRRIQGKLIQCYDDRFVVRLAVEHDGVIVSNDHFRDVQRDFPEWKDFIQKRLLMYTFAGDVFMPPDDPLGRHGPSLDDFLRKNVEPRGQQYCPYGRKCTFGPKCKFYHPDSRRHSGIFIKKPLPPLPREGSGGSSRPRSDPCHQSDPRRDGSRQRPASLPNLEQLYISPPHSLHKFIYHQSSQPVSHSHGRPVSGPPFPDNADAHYLLSSAGDVQTQRCRSTTDMYVPQQKQVNLQRKLSGDVSLVSPAVLQPPFIAMHPPNRRPPSGEFIAHTLQPGVDFVGRPLSSEYGSRPSSGEYSYSSGSRPPSGEYMRPMSGEFNGSRPSSGDYGTPPWSYQRQVAFPNAIINQYPERNFYPVKGYYKTRGPPMPETKEEPRQHPNGLKIELVEQLRTLFPDLYDKILYVLRTYPNITCVEDAIPLLK